MTWELSIDKIIGTSTSSAAQWTVQGSQIAYTASNGVVLATYNESRLKLEKQRFFCANNSVTTPGSEYQFEDNDDTSRDSFGFAVNDPVIIRNREEEDVSLDSNTPTPLAMGALTSPSKFKKSRNITSVALSPNGRLLAVGESGFQPRILVYSLAPDLGSTPVIQVFEHSFGILHLHFSPDLKLLMSLGVVSDGFVKVWKIGSTISLLSLNKCTSLVNQVIWQNPHSFVTIGLRFIKVWHIDGNKVLKGRNAILGPLINSNFISGHSLDEEEIVLLTSENQMVLLNTVDATVKFVDYAINDAIGVTGDCSSLWILSRDGTLDLTPIDLLAVMDQIPKPEQKKSSSSPLKLGSMKAQPDFIPEIVNILDLSADHLVLLTGSKGITLFNKNKRSVSNLTNPIIPHLAGFDVIEGSSKILVLAKSGEAKLINTGDEDIQVEDLLTLKQKVENPNGIAFISEEELAVGDKEGNLYFFTSKQGSYSLFRQFKAHSSAVNEIVHLNIEGTSVVVSIARDRMIQIFKKESEGWDLLRTLNLHNGNLTQLDVDRKYNRIYVGSLDRSLSIHTIIKNPEGSLEVNLHKLISLRTAPIALKITDQDIIVSTNDRTLQIYSNKNCDYKRTLKLYNDKDSLLIEEMLVLGQQIIVSSADKSVRVFNYSLGKPVLTLWGQLDLKLFKCGEKSLLGLNSEGCVIRYNIEMAETDDVIVSTKVTRKIVAPVRKLTNSSISSNSDTSSGSISLLPAETSSTSLTAPNSKKGTPLSSPRLTGATIKRLEARGISPSSLIGGSSIGLGSSKAGSRSSSPMKPPLNVQLSTALKDKPNLRSPGKSSTPLSPVAVESRRLSSPSKTPFSTSTVERKVISGHKLLAGRQASSSPSRPGSRATSINKTLVSVTRYLEVLDKIIESLGRGEIGDQDIPMFAQKIDHIRTILDIYDTDGSDIEQEPRTLARPLDKEHTQILEEYSDKLVLLVRSKLDDLSMKDLGPD